MEVLNDILGYKGLKLYPEHYGAWYNLGNINYMKGDYEASIKALNISKQSEVFKDKSPFELSKTNRNSSSS